MKCQKLTCGHTYKRWICQDADRLPNFMLYGPACLPLPHFFLDDLLMMSRAERRIYAYLCQVAGIAKPPYLTRGWSKRIMSAAVKALTGSGEKRSLSPCMGLRLDLAPN
jgi:hypothetical protein